MGSPTFPPNRASGGAPAVGTAPRPESPQARPLRTRIERPARDLELALRREIVGRERALLVRLYLPFLTWRGLRRLVHHVAGAVVVIPLLNFLLTPLGFDDLQIQVLLAAAFGAVIAIGRPRGTVVGFLLATTALLTLVGAGYVRTLTDVLHTVLALLCYFGLGLALGITENLVRHGE